MELWRPATTRSVPRDWDFLTSLSNCSNLEILDFEQNNLEGVMPVTLANLSRELDWITIGRNKIAGTIPAGLGKYQKLTKFYGQIPQSLGNITQLNNLSLSNNFLDGSIPSSIGNLPKLVSLDLSGNGKVGEIPHEILSITSLTLLLNLSNNALSGSIPTQIGKLNNLVTIDLSINKLSGEIPDALGSCVQLNFLYLQGNFLQGQIPKDFSSIRGFVKLDISNNNLAGPIPEFLSVELLTYLNLSFNNLSGPVPNTWIFHNSIVMLLPGNSMLCGGPASLQLSSCPYIRSNQASQHRRRVILFCMVGTLVFFMCSLTACYLMKPRNKPNIVDQETGFHHERICYAEIDAATESFSPENFIGSVSFDNVYIGTLNLDDSLYTVAIKVLNLGKRGANRSFLREGEALRKIRHRNLVKVITVCSSLNGNGDEFKALVLDLICNGNLNDLLCIALDVGEALEYLQHQIEPSIVHCDSKPCNILLDDDIVAHVTDFGLAKIMHTDECMHSGGGTESSSHVIKGTIGYNQRFEPSTDGDVYSYGVLLLEIFTGRRPTDNFTDGVTSQLLLEIVHGSATYSRDTECIIDILLYPIFVLGLAFCHDSTRHRMKMMHVVKELNVIKRACEGDVPVHEF
ncbi:hypothetical protein ZWY2020_047523 [Hordeum vulgare]|nr:hypothetical protein ZWY2020_047523 [Hordeum vulgare]